MPFARFTRATSVRYPTLCTCTETEAPVAGEIVTAPGENPGVGSVDHSMRPGLSRRSELPIEYVDDGLVTTAPPAIENGPPEPSRQTGASGVSCHWPAWY